MAVVSGVESEQKKLAGIFEQSGPKHEIVAQILTKLSQLNTNETDDIDNKDNVDILNSVLCSHGRIELFDIDRWFVIETPTLLVTALYHLYKAYMLQASNDVKQDWIKVVICLINHGCPIDCFWHSKYFPRNLHKKENLRWTDWAPFHFIQNYFSKYSQFYVEDLKSSLLECCNKDDGSKYLPCMVEIVWCQGTGENLFRKFESSFVFDPRHSKNSKNDNDNDDMFGESDESDNENENMNVFEQLSVFRNFRIFGGHYPGLPPKLKLIEYFENGVIPFGISSITTFSNDAVSPIKRKFNSIEQLLEFTKFQFGPKFKNYDQFPVLNNVRLCKRQSLAPIILYAVYVTMDEMRNEKLKLINRNDKITNKYCGNEWIGDIYWNIILDYIYGNTLSFPCLPWNYHSLFELQFETFCSLRFSDMKGMLVTHFAKPIEYYLYVKQLLSDYKFICKIYQTNMKNNNEKKLKPSLKPKPKKEKKIESNDKNGKKKNSKVVRKYSRNFSYVDVIHIKIDLLLNAQFWELGIILINNIVKAKKEIKMANDVGDRMDDTKSEMKEEMNNGCIEYKVVQNELPKCINHASNKAALELAILLLENVDTDNVDCKQMINNLKMTKYEAKLAKRKNLLLTLIDAITNNDNTINIDKEHENLICKFLILLKKLGYNYGNNENSSSLIFAASKNCMWLVKVLIEECQCDINVRNDLIDENLYYDDYCDSCLSIACFATLDTKFNYSFEMIDYLLTLANFKVDTIIFDRLFNQATKYDKLYQKTQKQSNDFEQGFIESQLRKLFTKLLDYCKKYNIDISSVKWEYSLTKRFPNLKSLFD